MKIETKFSIGDSVWVMKDGKPFRFTVSGIHADATLYGEATICYGNVAFESVFPESACYATKEELLASL